MLLTMRTEETPSDDALLTSDRLPGLAAALDDLTNTTFATAVLAYLPGDADAVEAHKVQGWLSPQPERLASSSSCTFEAAHVRAGRSRAGRGGGNDEPLQALVEAAARAQLARITRLLRARPEGDEGRGEEVAVRQRRTRALLQLAMGAAAVQLEGTDFGGTRLVQSVAQLVHLEPSVLEVLLRITNGVEVPKEALQQQHAGSRSMVTFVTDLLGRSAVASGDGDGDADTAGGSEQPSTASGRRLERALGILNYIVGLTHRQPRCFNHLAALRTAGDKRLEQSLFATMVGSDLADSEGHLGMLCPQGCSQRVLWAVLKLAEHHRPLDHALAAVDLLADRLDIGENTAARLHVRTHRTHAQCWSASPRAHCVLSHVLSCTCPVFCAWQPASSAWPSPRCGYAGKGGSAHGGRRWHNGRRGRTRDRLHECSGAAGVGGRQPPTHLGDQG